MDMHPEFSHWVSQSGDIVDVSETWLSFARDNGWDIDTKNVVGHHWTEYVKCAEVRKLYEQLMDHVRSTGQPARLHYRCDSPEQKRFHQMKIAWDRRRSVYEFRNRILETEDLKNKINLTAAQGGAEDDAFDMCSWCKKVKTPDGEWVNIEDMLATLEAQGQEFTGEVNHDACPDCLATLNTSVAP